MAKKASKDVQIQNTSDSDLDSSVLTSVMIPSKLKKEMTMYCAVHNMTMKDLILRGIKKEMNIKVED